MNTFLPYPSFEDSAKVLDSKRLGNQRNECKVILKTLLGEYKKGWIHHPAVKMWRNHEYALCQYGIAICKEFIKRGNNDSVLQFFENMLSCLPENQPPSWLGGAIHASHRSNLLRKNPQWYGQFGWKEKSGLPYVWGNTNK